TNASGSRALRHGYTRDHVESLRVVLDNGEVVAVSRERRHSVAREANPDSSVVIPLPSPRLDDIVASLGTLLEQHAELIRAHRALSLVERVQRQERRVVHARVASEMEEMERLWRIRESALPGLYGLRGKTQAVAAVEDVGVPPESLGVYLDGVQKILQEHEAT